MSENKGRRRDSATAAAATGTDGSASAPGTSAGPRSVWMALSGVGVVVIVALVSWLMSGTIRVEREAQEFASNSIVSVCAEWDPAVLARLADPEFMKAMPEAEMRKFIEGLGATLGPGIRSSVAKGRVSPQRNTPEGKTTMAEFVSEVECAKGTATIRQTIVKQDGVWRIRSFSVDPKDIKPQAQ